MKKREATQNFTDRQQGGGVNSFIPVYLLGHFLKLTLKPDLLRRRESQAQKAAKPFLLTLVKEFLLAQKV